MESVRRTDDGTVYIGDRILSDRTRTVPSLPARPLSISESPTMSRNDDQHLAVSTVVSFMAGDQSPLSRFVL